ncbi:MAG: succinate dehydrogenase/fumarate reductase iron-sulfur subunit [Myxococcales bacterium]|nr:succinate dehydrogenase/fumarate reductase iron-sulfur subunit [Myxococcales bacterium]MCB9533033.1 succinate dehydrogenase/fumarate reductase iron-sulfur subunit [Myxococcales bacterium]
MADTISVTLRVWRQAGPNAAGRFEDYPRITISTHASFLELLDVLNERLVGEGKEPVVFAHDCREGICGTCGFVINGQAHGKDRGTTVCQLHMRRFSDGDTIVVEPWRARAFPVIRDLMVDRSAFDRIQQAGGYNGVNVGNAPDANSILVGRDAAALAFDAATCIGCGACVAACPNASAMLFTAAKVGQFAVLPQGQPERERRALRMVAQMDAEGFGACTNTLECEAACPKEISTAWIQRLNREYLRAALVSEEGARRAASADD